MHKALGSIPAPKKERQKKKKKRKKRKEDTGRCRDKGHLRLPPCNLRGTSHCSQQQVRWKRCALEPGREQGLVGE
jgi:hypothetical protein